ncbi:DUF3891 family protein [bacterium]|nr:MAG: DUF3891 family protein [bacterium]
MTGAFYATLRCFSAEPMFKAKHSNLIFTQYEHQKLSGVLALLWGNEEFEAPPCSFESFVKGVALHDRGYETFDNLSIGEISEEEWLKVSRKGFFLQYDDAIADVIAKKHILRLAQRSDHQDDESVALIEAMVASIEGLIRDKALDVNMLAFIDRITDLCDSISFDFCFQNYGTESVEVQSTFGDEKLTRVEYTLGADNIIKISPWPLSVPHYEGYLIAYQAEGFPGKLEPEIIRYTLRGEWE